MFFLSKYAHYLQIYSIILKIHLNFFIKKNSRVEAVEEFSFLKFLFFYQFEN